MSMAKHNWDDPEYNPDAYIPQHFTLGCIGCDGQAEAEEEDDWFDDHEEGEDEGPTPLQVTLATDWCFECGRRIDPLGWVEEHLDRFLWSGDELIATGQMIKERCGSPELVAYIDESLQQVGEYVVQQFQQAIDQMANR